MNSSTIRELILNHLTEEWLLKFGFTLYFNEDRECGVFNIVNKGVLCDFEIDFSTDLEDNKYDFYACEFQYQMEIKLPHVHSLQNLYFALTGEELTIK